MKHIYNTCTHGQGSISPWLIFGAHDDKASSRASLLTGGREATSKKTLKEASSRSTPRTAVIHMGRLIVGETLVVQDLLVGVFVSDGFQFVIRRGGEHVVQFPDDRRQVRELVARVELQDGSLWHTTWIQAGRFKVLHDDEDEKQPHFVDVAVK